MHTGFWWGNPKGKRLLGRPRRRWDDNIKLDLQEVRWGEGGMDWIDLAQEAGTFNCSNEHSVSIKRREFFD